VLRRLAFAAVGLLGCAPSKPTVARDVQAAPASSTGVVRPADEDGYRLWLRYRKLDEDARTRAARDQLGTVVLTATSPTREVIRSELTRGLGGLLGRAPSFASEVPPAGQALVLARTGTGEVEALGLTAPGLTAPVGLGDGYVLRSVTQKGRRLLVVASESDLGLLYGTFALFRELERGSDLGNLSVESRPRIDLRLLNHWDNLDGSVERGYAGRSIWKWDEDVARHAERYRDYARACASVGINGAAITSVNANASALTERYLKQAGAIADVMRPYGVRVFLTARFSAPSEIGGLSTSDPLEPQVAAFWRDKVSEIYRYIPDFGGFVVKANSEGQPGPQDFGRSHAEGANVLARALAPHGGSVMWRAFVYSAESPADRIRQAYDEFHPKDGQFDANVFVQVKNGPLDFQPREPIHPLLGGMPKTPLTLELQITKEYLGQDTHLAYLGPLFEETLDQDTFASGPGSTVARIVEGAFLPPGPSAIAGVANVGDDRDWTGSHFNQANWYAFGRLAWDPELASADIAAEWARATWSREPEVVDAVSDMMMASREAVVDYMTPLGLVHLMAEGHHYGPGPWVDGLARADWNSTYYHRADASGVGFDRTSQGSGAVLQYHSPLRELYADRHRVPLEYLLYFHHVGWNERISTGRTLWHELATRYERGVRTVGRMRAAWRLLEGSIDRARFRAVAEFLAIQESEARWWRDASLTYFSGFSGQTWPSARSLSDFQHLPCPKDRDRPRCPEVYDSAAGP